MNLNVPVHLSTPEIQCLLYALSRMMKEGGLGLGDAPIIHNIAVKLQEKLPKPDPNPAQTVVPEPPLAPVTAEIVPPIN